MASKGFTFINKFSYYATCFVFLCYYQLFPGFTFNSKEESIKFFFPYSELFSINILQASKVNSREIKSSSAYH